MEVSGPTVISQPLPRLQDLVGFGSSKSLERGEPPHPALVVSEDGLDAGLLEHELGDEHPIGIRVVSPRERSACPIVVAKEGRPPFPIRIATLHGEMGLLRIP